MFNNILENVLKFWFCGGVGSTLDHVLSLLTMPRIEKFSSKEEGDQAKISPKKQNGANMLAFTRVLVRSPRAADLCRSRIAGSDMPAACCSDLSTRNASLVKFTPCFAFTPRGASLRGFRSQ